MKSLCALRYSRIDNSILSEKFLTSIIHKSIPFGMKLDNTRNFGSKSSSSSSSSSSSDSDDEAVKPKLSSQIKKEDTVNKLNNLLKQLIEQDEVAKSSKLDLAKPTDKRNPKKSYTEKTLPEISGEQIANAAKNAAEELGGNIKETESELLTKLLNTMEPVPITKNLSEIVKGMKIDRTTKNSEQSRADQIRNILQQVQIKHKVDSKQFNKRERKLPEQRQKQDFKIHRINLFGSDPLGIFTNKLDLKEVPDNRMLEELRQRDLKLAVTHPPSNYFQQMILWTNQGKLWRFPIDNEQGLEEEKNVSFAEHVFLEEHLEPWCPTKGPVRHFMELVCVGLSKNSYLTVQAKKDHINWFRNYFEDKKQLLQEVGAFPVEIQKH